VTHSSSNANSGASPRALRRVGIAGLCALGLGIGCSDSEPHVDPIAIETAPEPVVEVEIDRVRRGSILQRISAPGSLVARRESRIGPEVRGRIAQIYVEEGDRVAEGAPLFEIDRESYALAVEQARARLDRARAEHRQIELNLARGRELRSSEVLAEQRLEELRTALTVAVAAEREIAEALAMAERNLARTLVRAPYAASIAARLEDEGTTALVQPQTIVVVLQETTALEARATIPEVHFAAIAVGDAALLYVQGLAQPIPTEVSTVSDSIDPATRTYVVTMKVDNADHRVKAGAFARIDILPRAKSSVLLLPREAIRREEGQTRVLTIRDGRAVAVPVKLGVIAEDAVEVLHGVRVDQEIVVGEAARTLAAGMRVSVTERNGPEAL